MAVERFALGDPAEVAARVRALAPAAASVTAAVGQIVANVRAHGDAALEAYVEHFDGRHGPLRVGTEELAAALDGLDPEVRAGLEVAIANVRAVAVAGRDDEREVVLPEGQVVRLREVAVRRAAIYVPGGRAPYPSTVVMGVVTARAAGVDEVVVCAPGAHPVDPRRVRAVRGRRGLPRWAARTPSPRWPTAPRACRAPTSSPAPATSTCRRPSGWSAATSASTASPGPPTCSCWPARAPTRRWWRSTSPPRPSTARAPSSAR